MRLKPDTSMRKRFFHESAMSHPAKLHGGLFLEIMERYTQPGDTILDVMGGIGTALLGAMYGRHIIVNELESHFLETVPKSWAKIQQNGPALGHTMGQVLILRGDARCLPLSSADAVITSPPYEEGLGHQGSVQREILASKGIHGGSRNYTETTRPVDAVVSSPPYANRLADTYVDDDPQRMSYEMGKQKLDAVISSPPYEGSQTSAGDQARDPGIRFPQGERTDRGKVKKDGAYQKGYTEMGKAKIDSIVSSPPWEDQRPAQDASWADREYLAGRLSGHGTKGKGMAGPAMKAGYTRPVDAVVSSPPFGEARQGTTRAGSSTMDAHQTAERSYQTPLHFATENIGNLKNDAYWSAMEQVYRECHRVLKDGGIMALVLKGFTRGGKYVDLPRQTADLVESLGFSLFDRWERELWTLSFWRILQKKNNPDGWDERLRYESVLAFRKE